MTEEKKATVVTGEMFRKLLDEAVAGDNIGCLLRGVNRKRYRTRSSTCKNPAASIPHKIQSEVYVLTIERRRRAVIHRSSTAIVRSSISEQQT